MKQPLKGIIPPLVTPLRECSSPSSGQELDIEATRKLIEHVMLGGCSGIFILGTTGEWPSLSMSLKIAFIHLCCDIVDGRIPVLVGVTDTCLENTLQLAQACKDASADCLVLTAPYYYPMDQKELVSYVQNIREETLKLEIPLMLYNMPGLTKVWFDVETLREMIAYPDIMGIKDSSGDLVYFEQICKLKQELRPDWTILMGPEHLTLDALCLGCDGGVNGGSQVRPDLFVELFKAAEKKDLDRAKEIQHHVVKFQEIYQVGTGAFPFIKTTKCALAIENLCSDLVASPFCRFSDDDDARSRIRKILESIPRF
jgi:2-dehydro-3-deoxy-D-pentonate aldolase